MVSNIDLPYDDPEEMKRQLQFYRDRLEAAEAKLSLLSRGYSIEEEKPKKKGKKDVR